MYELQLQLHVDSRVVDEHLFNVRNQHKVSHMNII